MKTKWHIYLIFILPILCIFLFISKADAQTWEWARRSRNGGANVDAYLTACDSKSNIYAAGFFNSSAISFGNTTIPYTLSNADDETFIVKYNSSGQVLWAKGILQGLNDPVSICTDPEGNLVLLGIFDAPRIKIDTFNLYNSLSAPGSSQYFIVKFAPGGNVIWAKTSGASSRFYAPSLRRSGGLFSYNRDCNTVLSWGAVATDNSDNIFVTGNYDAASNTIGSFREVYLMGYLLIPSWVLIKLQVIFTSKEPFVSLDSFFR